jgi:histidine triad (HIT) family protein
MDDGCIFCRIVAGTIPSTRVYEDDQAIAFLDIGPIVKGHTLVIPRAHVDPLDAVPPDLLARLIAVVQRVARAQVAGLKADGVNVHQSNGACAGQAIPHVHFHVIPRFHGDGHQWNWCAGRYAGPPEMAETAARIRAGLGA